MIPVFCFVGRSGAGKTTLLERLVPELASRGFRVACLKHTHHEVELDTPGTDTFRLRVAGAEAVGLVPGVGQTLFGDWLGDDPLAAAAALLGDRYDVVLAEGFRSSAHPKIEVARADAGKGLLCEPSELLAVVSDQPAPGVEVAFALDEIGVLADFIEARLAPPDDVQSVDLLVDGEAVALNPFLTTVLERVVVGVMGSLKGVPEKPGDIQLRVRAGVRATDGARS